MKTGGVTDYQASKAQMLAILVNVAQNRHLITYRELGVAMSPPLHHRNRLLYELLQDICYDEAQANRPNLCALVVRKSSGIPGIGFFVGMATGYHDAHDYWQTCVQHCWAYWAGEPQP
ncbi:MAG: hypothetical protein ACOYLB_04520 [Phototrophicaceae bacterium]